MHCTNIVIDIVDQVLTGHGDAFHVDIVHRLCLANKIFGKLFFKMEYKYLFVVQ